MKRAHAKDSHVMRTLRYEGTVRHNDRGHNLVAVALRRIEHSRRFRSRREDAVKSPVKKNDEDALPKCIT